MNNQNSFSKIIRDNRKVIYFLLRFFIVFGGLSLLYGLWIKSFGDKADTFSWVIGKTLVWINGSENMQLQPTSGWPSIGIIYKGSEAVSLFEGCNGIAVMILFVAFVIAFKGSWQRTTWFCVLGIVVIHLANIARLQLLLMLADKDSEWFHFMHKYLFSLIIYAVVFLLWVIWIKLAGGKQPGIQNNEV